MFAGDAVQRAVFVDVTRAERLEAEKADPVLDGSVTLSTLAFVVDRCGNERKIQKIKIKLRKL